MGGFETTFKGDYRFLIVAIITWLVSNGAVGAIRSLSETLKYDSRNKNIPIFINSYTHYMRISRFISLACVVGCVSSTTFRTWMWWITGLWVILGTLSVGSAGLLIKDIMKNR